MSPDQFRSIPGSDSFEFVPCGYRILQADGSEIKTWGKTEVNMEVGGCSFSMDVIVAEVTHGILGMDFMWRVKPSVDLEALHMTVGGQEVPLRNRSDSPLFSRVVASDDVWIPSDCRMIISATVHGNTVKELGMLEPVTRGDLIESGILVARAVVNTGNEFPVEVLNVGEHPKLVKRGTVLAKFEPVSQHNIIM